MSSLNQIKSEINKIKNNYLDLLRLELTQVEKDEKKILVNMSHGKIDLFEKDQVISWIGKGAAKISFQTDELLKILEKIDLLRQAHDKYLNIEKAVSEINYSNETHENLDFIRSLIGEFANCCSQVLQTRKLLLDSMSEIRKNKIPQIKQNLNHEAVNKNFGEVAQERDNQYFPVIFNALKLKIQSDPDIKQLIQNEKVDIKLLLTAFMKEVHLKSNKYPKEVVTSVNYLINEFGVGQNMWESVMLEEMNKKFSPHTSQQVQKLSQDLNQFISELKMTQQKTTQTISIESNAAEPKKNKPDLDKSTANIATEDLSGATNTQKTLGENPNLPPRKIAFNPAMLKHTLLKPNKPEVTVKQHLDTVTNLLNELNNNPQP